MTLSTRWLLPMQSEQTKADASYLLAGLGGAIDVHEHLNLVHAGNPPWTQELAWRDEFRHVWVSVFHRCTHLLRET